MAEWRDVLGEEGMEEFKQKKQDGIERRTVERLINALGGNTRRIREFSDSTAEGRSGVCWAYFHELHPEFPFFLGARNLHSLSGHNSMKASNFLMQFKRSPLLQAYKDFLEESEIDAGNRPVGLVVAFHGYQAGIVIHNQNQPVSYGPSWCYRAKVKSRDVVFWIEPYSRFLTGLKEAKITIEA